MLPKFIVLPKFSFWYGSIVLVKVTEFSSPQEGGPAPDSNVKENNIRLLSLILLTPFSLLLSAWIFCLVFRKVYFKTCLGNLQRWRQQHQHQQQQQNSKRQLIRKKTEKKQIAMGSRQGHQGVGGRRHSVSN